jgi:hypothetical protein
MNFKSAATVSEVSQISMRVGRNAARQFMKSLMLLLHAHADYKLKHCTYLHKERRLSGCSNQMLEAIIITSDTHYHNVTMFTIPVTMHFFSRQGAHSTTSRLSVGKQYSQTF